MQRGHDSFKAIPSLPCPACPVVRHVTDLFLSHRHLTLILTTIRYGLSWFRMNYYTRMAQFSYRTAFISAAVTYGIVVYKTLRARAKTGNRAPGGVVGLLSDENIQYLSKFAPILPLLILLTFLLTLLSHGPRLALHSPVPSGSSPLRHLLGLPRCYLHSRQPDPRSLRPQERS